MASDALKRFTKRAKRVLKTAQEEAEKLRHPYIGTEHVLLGLIREEGCMAVKVLHQLGVDPRDVVQAVHRLVDAHLEVTYAPELTNRTKRVIQLAVEEARLMEHQYIGTEHLLLGLMREQEGLAGGVLQRLGLDLERVRLQTTRVILESQAQDPEAYPEPAPFEDLRDARPQSGRGRRSRGQTPLLDQLGTDLTALAEADRLDPVIGRHDEIDRVVQILSRRTKNNPVLIGEPGIGKTSVVEGLAHRISIGNVPETLLNRRIIRLDLGGAVAGAMYWGHLEERLAELGDEICQSDSILFIPQVHLLVASRWPSISVGASVILEPALVCGKIHCIGTASSENYRTYIEADASLGRYFRPVLVQESTPEETLDILRGVKAHYEAHHQLEILDEAVEAATYLTVRYVTDRFLPDKAIDAMDEAAASVRFLKDPLAAGLCEVFVALKSLRRQLKDALDDQRFDDAADLRYREIELNERVRKLRQSREREARPTVTADDVAEVVSLWAGVPPSQLAADEP